MSCRAPTVWGSSPLTRGKRGRERDRRAPRLAHPRSRGENRVIFAAWRALSGSSPLTRGKLVARDSRALRGGLIPAHAGKTVGVHCSLLCCGAHPRSRGENTFAFTTSTQKMGSSPLTRGKPRSAVQDHESDGLIPAHAGKTSTALSTASRAPAHPRSRGENRSIMSSRA